MLWKIRRVVHNWLSVLEFLKCSSSYYYPIGIPHCCIPATHESLFYFDFFFSVYGVLPAHMCAGHLGVACEEARREWQILWNQNYRCLLVTICLLGTKSKSSVRASSALRYITTPLYEVLYVTFLGFFFFLTRHATLRTYCVIMRPLQKHLSWKCSWMFKLSPL